MLELLMIELALGAPGILVAAFVIVMRRRRSSDQPGLPVAERRGSATKSADEETAQREAADVPGLSHDTVERDLGANVPVKPEQPAQSQVGGVADPGLGSIGPDTEPDEQHVTAGAVPCTERIVSYYAEADRPMAEYLAARGWTEQPGTHDPR